MSVPSAGPAGTIVLDGAVLDRLDAAGVADAIADAIAAGRGGWLATLNLQYLVMMRRDPGFRELVNGADLRCADGVPLVWASRMAGTPLPGRVNGTDLIAPLATRCRDAGRSLALVGGRPGAAEASGRILAERIPGLRIGPVACPPPGFAADAAAQERVLAELRAAEPGLVLMAFGAPAQDRLCAAWRDRLPLTWLVGIGGSLELISGQTPRAPRWMRRCGGEWLHRLASEPRRLAHRYLVECLPYGIGLGMRALGMRFRR